MSQSPYTVFYLFICLLLSVGFAYVEIAWLRRTPQLSALWLIIIAVAALNFCFLLFGIYTTLVDSYAGYIFFPIPIGQTVFVLLKVGLYFIIQRLTKSDVHSPWLVAISTGVAGAIVSAILLSWAARINPTYQNFYQAITERKNLKLKTMLWLSVTREPMMTDMINTALYTKNTYAIQKLTRHGANPELSYSYNQSDDSTAWELVKWQLDNSKNVNEIATIAEILSHFSIDKLKYGLDAGIDLRKHPDFLHQVIRGFRERAIKRPSTVNKYTDMIATLKFLLDQGADMNSEDQYGYKPVVVLFTIGLPVEPVLRFMIARGARINEPTHNAVVLDNGAYLREGFTLLMAAAASSDEASVRLLLESGADRNMKNSEDKTALDYALDQKASEEIIRMLKAAGQ